MKPAIQVTAAIALALISIRTGYAVGRRIPTYQSTDPLADGQPPGLPYLSTDLEELLGFTNEIIAAVEQGRLGDGPEIDNLEATANSVITSCRWLVKHKAPA